MTRRAATGPCGCDGWKRIWSCADPDCEVRTWTERATIGEPRRLLTARAGEWATNRVPAVEGTPSSIARESGVSWATVWSAVERIVRQRVDDAGRVGPVAMVGFDETVMSPASRRRRRRFVTVVLDVTTGQLIDVFEGRDAGQLRAWMADLPPSWLAQVQVVSVDPHEGYRSAVTGAHPITGRSSPLAHVAVVVDPFHVVRLRQHGAHPLPPAGPAGDHGAAACARRRAGRPSGPGAIAPSTPAIPTTT